MIGIDLGTTNSAIAVWHDGQPRLIPNSLGQVLTPSAVSIDEDGQLLVGMAARERQVTHPRMTATAFKRYMGTNRVTRLGDREFPPEELSALVLRSLKSDAERDLGVPVTSAIITVPAYFNDKQRKATRRAGELASLGVDRLINEPTAAALAYGIDPRSGSPTSTRPGESECEGRGGTASPDGVCPRSSLRDFGPVLERSSGVGSSLDGDPASDRCDGGGCPVDIQRAHVGPGDDEGRPCKPISFRFLQATICALTNGTWIGVVGWGRVWPASVIQL